MSIQALYKSSNEIKEWFEGIRPIHQFGTFTFTTDVPETRAIKDLWSFFDDIARDRKEHIFLCYCWGSQAARTDKRHGGTHFHTLVSYEGFNQTIPSNNFIESRWWHRFSPKWVSSDTSKIAMVEGYNPDKCGVYYTILKHGYEDNWNLYVACPHNQHRCNGKDRVCHFEQSAELWRVETTTR